MKYKKQGRVRVVTFIAISKARNENVDIKRIVGKVICPKPCEPAYFTAPSGGKVKKCSFFTTAKSYFDAAKGLTSGNIKETINGAGGIIQGATRVVVTHKVSQKPVLCCAKVVAGVGLRGNALLFDTSNENMKKQKKIQKRKQATSRFEENDESQSLFAAARDIGDSLLNFTEGIQRLNGRFEAATRLSLVFEGRAGAAGQLIFSTGSTLYEQTIASGNTANDVAEQLATTLLADGFTVFGPEPADALDAAGVPDLATLASVDPTYLRVPGLRTTQLQKFVGMANIARTVPILSKDDIQVLVEGFNIPDDESLLSFASGLEEDDIWNAALKVETPKGYDSRGLITLIKTLKR